MNNSDLIRKLKASRNAIDNAIMALEIADKPKTSRQKIREERRQVTEDRITERLISDRYRPENQAEVTKL